MDSPLAKSGRLKIFIHTTKNILIDIDPSCRIPRTFKRFCGLMVQLLHSRKIKAVDTDKTLLKVIKNPITRHLPAGSVKIGMSVEGELVNINEFIRRSELRFVRETDNDEVNVPVFIIGACAHGHPGLEAEYKDYAISISNYHLSAASASFRICSAFETLWNIL